jgi:excisionase family DNA binding protein
MVLDGYRWPIILRKEDQEVDETEPARMVSVPRAARRLAIGRSKCWQAVSSGELGSVKIGRRRLVPVEAIDAYVAKLIADRDASAATSDRRRPRPSVTVK